MATEVDWAALKAAIASHGAEVTGIRYATSTDLDSAPVTPALIVTHLSSLDVLDRGIGWERQEAEVSGVLVLSTAPGAGAALEEADGLIDGLLQRYRDDMNLGYPGVVQDSWMKGATQDLIEVGSIKYAGYRLRWSVTARMGVTRSMS